MKKKKKYHLPGCEFEKLSRTIHSNPAFTNSTTQWLPMKPAPPVTNTVNGIVVFVVVVF